MEPPMDSTAEVNYSKFQRSLRTLDKYQHLEDGDQMQYCLVILLIIALLWDLESDRFAKTFVDTFPPRLMKRILTDPKYDTVLVLDPEFKEKISLEESLCNLKEAAFLLLSYACTCKELHYRIDEWDILDEIMGVFYECPPHRFLDGIVMYLVSVYELGKDRHKLLNQKLLVGLAQIAVSDRRHDSQIKDSVSYLLIQIQKLMTEYNLLYTDSSQKAPMTPEELLYILEPTADFLVDFFMKSPENIHAIFELLPVLSTIEKLGHNSKRLKQVLAPIYLDRIRHGFKMIYSSKFNIQEHQDFYKRLVQCSDSIRNVSAINLLLSAISIVGSCVGEDWLMTTVNVKYHKPPVNISNAQFTAIVVSSAVIEIDLHLTSIQNDGKYDVNISKEKEQDLIMLISIAKHALNYLNIYSAKHVEDDESMLDKTESSDENSLKFTSTSIVHIINVLRQLSNSARNFLVDFYDYNYTNSYGEVKSPFINELISYVCTWVIYHIDECTSYLDDMINMILTVFEKSSSKNDDDPIYAHFWFFIELINYPELIAVHFQKLNFLSRLFSIWINQPLPMKFQMDYIIAMVPYKIISDLDTIVIDLHRTQHEKLLDRLAFMINMVESLDSSECKIHYKGILAFIGASIISQTCVNSKHIDLFVDSYIESLTGNLIKGDTGLITKAPKVVLEIADLREPPLEFGKFRRNLDTIKKISRDNYETISNSDCPNYLGDIIVRISGNDTKVDTSIH